MLSKLLALAVSGQGSVTDYWFATYGDTGYTVEPADVHIASDESIYIAGWHTDPAIGGNPVQNGLIIKYTAAGALSWQKTVGTGTVFDGYNWVYGVTVGSDDNVYIAGKSENEAGAFVHSYTQSGINRWKRVLDSGGIGIDSFSGISGDNANNVYVAGYGFNTELTIAKYNSFGVLQFQRELAGGSNRAEGIACDANGNSYVTGRIVTTSIAPVFAKYSSSGTLLWQRRLDFSSTSFTGNKVAVDSNAVYFATSKADAELVKYDLNGTLQWQRQLTAIAGVSGVTVDTFGNVYLCASNYIVKYNSAGTLQWQRQIVNASGFVAIKHFKGAIYVVGKNNDKLFIAKVPDNGSLTGTYGSFTYQVSSLTSSAGAATSATTSLPSFTTTSADSAGTIAVESLTLTSTKTDI